MEKASCRPQSSTTFSSFHSSTQPCSTRCQVLPPNSFQNHVPHALGPFSAHGVRTSARFRNSIEPSHNNIRPLAFQSALISSLLVSPIPHVTPLIPRSPIIIFPWLFHCKFDVRMKEFDIGNQPTLSSANSVLVPVLNFSTPVAPAPVAPASIHQTASHR